MITLKLFTNWMDKASEKVYSKNKKGNRVLQKSISSKNQKEILKLIAKGKVTEGTDNYTIYQIGD